jgi:hypothetical protein
MRTLIWCLGVLVLTAWASVLRELGHNVPWTWWAWMLLWIFLGCAVAGTSAVRWMLEKYKAGALGTPGGMPAGAPDEWKKGGT